MIVSGFRKLIRCGSSFIERTPCILSPTKRVIVAVQPNEALQKRNSKIVEISQSQNFERKPSRQDATTLCENPRNFSANLLLLYGAKIFLYKKKRIACGLPYKESCAFLFKNQSMDDGFANEYLSNNVKNATFK
jgi:hypothetical protein